MTQNHWACMGLDGGMAGDRDGSERAHGSKRWLAAQTLVPLPARPSGHFAANWSRQVARLRPPYTPGKHASTHGSLPPLLVPALVARLQTEKKKGAKFVT